MGRKDSAQHLEQVQQTVRELARNGWQVSQHEMNAVKSAEAEYDQDTRLQREAGK